MNFSPRMATLNDVPALEELIRLSARKLGRPDYTETQIEAALGTAWGVDRELIQDGTYFVVVEQDQIVACGGWSFRETLFGGDGQPGRKSRNLDPLRESARIRAFFVHPDRARLGLGRLLLEKCETEAKARGFRKFELVATLPGQKLYRKFGYQGEKRVEYPLRDGVTIEFIPMKKEFS